MHHRTTLLLLLVTMWSVIMSAPAKGDEREGLILLPILIQTPGAYNSYFTTKLGVFNSGDETQTLHGIHRVCQILCPPDSERIVQLEPRRTEWSFSLDGNPGQLVRIDDLSALQLNLRVWDESRNSLSAGTNIPVIRVDHFFDSSIYIALRDGSAELFRSTLRVYAVEPTSVNVRFWREAPVGGVVLQSELTLPLNPGLTEYHPSYAELGQAGFPGPSEVLPATDALIVEIEPAGNEPIWAFVSTTNNVTQEITIALPGSLWHTPRSPIAE